MPAYKLTEGVNGTQCANFSVKFKDIFDIKTFYEVLHFWLLEYGWSSVASDGMDIEDKDYWETEYLEKEGAVGDKEMWWWWRMQKVPTDSTFYKYHLDVDSHILFLLPSEVMRDGKKFKVFKGEIEVNVAAWIEFNVGKEWDKQPLLNAFNRLFTQRIFKKELYEDHKLELYREAYTFQAFLKRWFKLYSFLPFEEVAQFHVSKSYPEWKKE